MTTEFLISDLKQDEGLRTESYQDTLGNWTWGYGHKDNHLGPGMHILPQAAYTLLLSDISTTKTAMDGIPSLRFWRTLDDLRQDVLVNMAFNLGAHALSTFTQFIAFVAAGQYAQAADDELHTLWARQVGGRRAVRLSDQMRTGVHV